MAGQFEQLDRELLSLVSTLRIQTGSFDSLVSTLRTHASVLVTQASTLGTILRFSVFELRPGNPQTVAISSVVTAMASGIAGAGARLYADASTHYHLASVPSANTTHPILPRGVVEKIAVRNGEKISTLLKTIGDTPGTLHVTTLDVP